MVKGISQTDNVIYKYVHNPINCEWLPGECTLNIVGQCDIKCSGMTCSNENKCKDVNGIWTPDIHCNNVDIINSILPQDCENECNNDRTWHNYYKCNNTEGGCKGQTNPNDSLCNFITTQDICEDPDSIDLNGKQCQWWNYNCQFEDQNLRNERRTNKPQYKGQVCDFSKEKNYINDNGRECSNLRICEKIDCEIDDTKEVECNTICGKGTKPRFIEKTRKYGGKICSNVNTIQCRPEENIDIECSPCDEIYIPTGECKKHINSKEEIFCGGYCTSDSDAADFKAACELNLNKEDCNNNEDGDEDDLCKWNQIKCVNKEDCESTNAIWKQGGECINGYCEDTTCEQDNESCTRIKCNDDLDSIWIDFDTNKCGKDGKQPCKNKDTCIAAIDSTGYWIDDLNDRNSMCSTTCFDNEVLSENLCNIMSGNWTLSDSPKCEINCVDETTCIANNKEAGTWINWHTKKNQCLILKENHNYKNNKNNCENDTGKCKAKDMNNYQICENYNNNSKDNCKDDSRCEWISNWKNTACKIEINNENNNYANCQKRNGLWSNKILGYCNIENFVCDTTDLPVNSCQAQCQEQTGTWLSGECDIKTCGDNNDEVCLTEADCNLATIALDPILDMHGSCSISTCGYDEKQPCINKYSCQFAHKIMEEYPSVGSCNVSICGNGDEKCNTKNDCERTGTFTDSQCNIPCKICDEGNNDCNENACTKEKM